MQKKGMRQRLLASVLAFTMAVMLPAAVFATTYDGAEALKNKLVNADVVDTNVVKLNNNVTINDVNLIVKGDVILDLNGHTLTLDGKVLACSPDGQPGTLTIRDSDTSGRGKITGTGLEGVLVQAQNGGTINIESGTIANTSSNAGNAAVDAILGSTLNMSGGTIIGKKFGLHTQDENTVVQVTGGTIKNEDAESAAVSVTNSSRFTMTAGQIDAAGQFVSVGVTQDKAESASDAMSATATFGGTAVVVSRNTTDLADSQVKYYGILNIQDNAQITGGIGVFENGRLNVSGGSITSNSNDFAISTNGSPDGQPHSSKGAIIKISGGTITGGSGTAAVYLPAGETTISGGTITGGAAVLARGGKVDITDGATLVSNATGETIEAGDAGYPVPAGALTVDDANYPAENNVTVSGGDFTGNVTFANKGAATAEAGEKLTVSGGTYSDPGDHFKNYLEEDKLAVGVNGTTYVGTQAEAAVNDLAEGDTLTVLQTAADSSLEIPAGVEVDNQTGNDIIVNGESVRQDEEIYTVDDTVLVNIMEEAARLTKEDYTAESWSALEDALTNAKTVLENKTLTDPDYQDKIDTAADAVKAAIADLAKVPEVTPEEPETPSDGWQKNDDGTYSYYKNGAMLTAQWLEENGKWYYLDADGKTVTGWLKDDGVWYYLNTDTSMATGWILLDGTWYYLNGSGAMMTDWQDINGTWYYFYGSGAMASSTWIGNSYVDESGAWIPNPVNEGWIKSGRRWWYQNANGSYPANVWKRIGGAWYHFDASGWMQTGWILDGSTWYYLNADGAMRTGWLKDGDTWYYLNADGAMRTGWFKDGDTWYYLNADGAMQTGWFKDGDTWYYLNADGAMQTGWILDGSTWYYLNEDGAMEHDTVIDGYRLDADGAWIK